MIIMTMITVIPMMIMTMISDSYDNDHDISVSHNDNDHDNSDSYDDNDHNSDSYDDKHKIETVLILNKLTTYQSYFKRELQIFMTTRLR